VGDVPIEIKDGERMTSTACSRLGACSPLRGGIGVDSSNQACSAAFVAKDGSARFLISAGHCDIDAGPTYRLDDGTTIGSEARVSWGDGTNADSLAISISNPSTDNLLYEIYQSPGNSITGRRSNAAQTQGCTACRSSRGGLTCATIVQTDTTVQTGPPTGSRHHQWIAGFASAGGDSGGTIFAGGQWFGVTAATGGGNTSYGTVSYVESVLGVTSCITASC
jgi:hypothetical protein